MATGGPRNGNRSKPRAVTAGAFSAFSERYPSGRTAVVFGLFILVGVLFVARLFYLQVLAAPQISNEALSQRLVEVPVTPMRGTIYDRNGKVLATSIEATTVYCNPKEIEDPNAAAQTVAAALGGSPDDYREALSNQESSFAYLKRQVDVEVVQKLREADLKGIYYVEDSKRVYPNGSIGGQVIGLVGIDGDGLTGLELYYDEVLGGTPGQLSMEVGANGYVIQGTRHETEPVAGRDIIISLDIDLQQKVEQTAAAFAKEEKAESGWALVMDGGTGEILACASTPYLDPGNIEDIPEHATEARCVTRSYEPGSIFKTVTMCAALEQGAVTPSSTIFCPSELPADEYVVRDAWVRTSTTMNATEILARSSNVGMSLIAQKMGFDVLDRKIHEYGLDNEVLGVDYPGESAGYLLDFDQWSRIQGYNISFGQGISITPLKIARFYGALVNDGVACTPHFLIEKPQDDEQVAWPTQKIINSSETIGNLTRMLMKVVEEGTGTGAQIDGYTPAGKTGTGEYIKEGHEEDGYLTDHYNVSFIGFLANTDSKLVCFVGATEVPGEPSTTPMFQDIMSYAIERYNINSTQR